MIAGIHSAVEGLAAPASEGASEPVKSQVDPGQIASKTAFLQLLVAQIRHQNPLNPADGVEFLTQLAQFSELEQIMGIREDLAALGQALAKGEVEEAAP